jgi:hypothetical protein
MSPKYSLLKFTENIFYVHRYISVIGQYHLPSLYLLHISREGPELLTLLFLRTSSAPSHAVQNVFPLKQP